MKTGSAGRAGPLGPPSACEGASVNAMPTGQPGGLSLPRRKTLPHGIPSWVEDGSVFFLTFCCARRGTHQHCRSDIAPVLFEAVEFRQSRCDWHVHLFMLMPDHLHMLVSFPREQEMKKTIANLRK